MGGIAGMIRFDGQPIDQADTTKIIQLLTHRGQVTSHAISQGIFINFGGDIDVSPSSSILATADASLFSHSPGHHVFTDIYSAKGPASLDNLHADFAVSIWDSQRQTLCLSRDILGVKPLYYVFQPTRFVAFASEIKALLALRDVPIKPNEHKFREYLTWITDYVPYSEETFYENIYSVLPGHYTQISAQNLETHPYWTINLAKFDALKSDEAFAAAFGDTFTAAIEHRISGFERIGSHLSGGLDSSSVSCVAQTLLAKKHRSSLHTFTIDTDFPEADEREYVQAVLDQYAIRAHTVRPVADVLESVLNINRIFDRPEHFIIPSSFHLSVSLQAKQVDCDLLLTGHDGDSVITTGFDFLDELLDAHDWDRLGQAVHQFIAPADRKLTYISPDWPTLTDQRKFERFVLYLLGGSLKKRLKSQSTGVFLRTLYTQKQLFGLSISAITAYCYKRISDKIAHRSLIGHALSPEFTRRVPQRPQRTTKELTTRLANSLNKPVRQILNTTNVICNEQLNHIGAYYGHQYSFPFFDRNVIEIGLATPLSVSFDEGRGRGLIRKGLKDVLPPAITSRLTKANFVEYGNLAAQQLYQSSYALFSSASHPIWGVVDRRTFSQLVTIVFDPDRPVVKKTRYNWLLSRIIYLALWLGSLPK